MKMKQLFGTLFLAISFIGTANAQLLYRVSGNGLEEPSYIIGTYHLAPASFVDDIRGAHEAMAAVEQVYGEVDTENLDRAQQLMLEAMMLPEGRRIADLFTEDEMSRINAYVREVMGVDLSNPFVAEQLGRMRPSVLAVQLLMLQYMKITPDFDATNLIDEYFQKEAHKVGKRVGGFESVEFQMELLYGEKSDEEERDELLELVDNNAETFATMQEMTEAYFSFDMKSIRSLTERELHNGDMTLEEFKELITDRNRRWVEAMPEVMREAPTLFVVGAGHLPGNEGVIALLKEAGYKVKPVR
ncbi:MAG: TraB/GumN family protein [Alistipes sp.]|nr:TraB/GumN family protein [Alistipes sp.]